MEVVWILLALVGLRSYAARPFLCVLVVKMAASYGAVWTSGGSALGYASTALVDIWALALLAPARSWRWGEAAWRAQVGAVVTQGVFWTAHVCGWYVGVEAFHIGRALFTGALIALAWPGGVDFAHDYDRWRRDVGRRKLAGSRLRGGGDVLGRVDSRSDPRREPPC